MMKTQKDVDDSPRQIHSALAYPFIQSCLLLNYVEELINKLNWLASQLPSSLSLSYA